MHRLSFFLVCSVPLLFCGCGGDAFETAEVKGKVTSGGEPVTGGKIIFTPESSDKSNLVGKSAVGFIESDGSFVLSTYSDGDGAVVGTHSVIVEGPEIPPEDTNEREGSILNVGSTDAKFTIKSGITNVVNVELTPPPKKKRGAKDDEDDDD